MTDTKLAFAYLYYTRTPCLGNDAFLIGVFKSSKIAKTHMDLVAGEYVPIRRDGLFGNSRRVMQKINAVTGQIWYVEKHVMKDAA